MIPNYLFIGFHCANVWLGGKQVAAIAAGIIQTYSRYASRAVFTLEEVLDELDNDEEMSDGTT